MSNWLSRNRRILGRIIQRKHLPTYVYRWDTRAPATIRATGFQPWNGGGTITLIEHVTGAFAAGHAQAGQSSKQSSQWVSAGAYGMLKRIDPTFAQQILNTNLYRIDTATAVTTGNFLDVNDAFDRAGIDRPYATQREWLKQGGIDQAAVTDTMPGTTFFNQYDMTNGAPDEANLTGWTAF